MSAPPAWAPDRLVAFVLWSRARPQRERILADLVGRFDLLEHWEITWTPARFHRDLSRFYGQRLRRGGHKMRHCGRGPFELLVVHDPEPVSEVRRTSSGPALVNAAAFDAKARYRDWTGGGHRVHASNTAAEARRDLFLLLGATPEEIVARATPRETPPRVRRVARDVVGDPQWRDLTEMFTALTAAGVDWVVLRNARELELPPGAGEHDDLDLLVGDPVEAALVLGAERTRREPWRVQHRVAVGERSWLVDLRTPGDGYYPEAWAREMLARRRPGPLVWELDDHDQYFALLYHALVHKGMLAADYRAELARLAPLVDAPDPTAPADAPAALQAELDRFLADRGWRYTDPDDLSVGLRPEVTGPDVVSTRRLLARSARGDTGAWRRLAGRVLRR